jgi:tetratricopeptide (TPR) repeat protein
MTIPEQEIQRNFQLAIQHHQAGRLAEAEGFYRQILSRVPNHPDALHLLGVLAGQAGRPNIGIDLINRAIAINPKTADYYCNLGEIYRRLGRLDEAIASSRRAIELRPDYVMAFSNLGVALRDSQKPNEAIEAFRRAIELGGNFAELYGNLGNALRDKGQLDAAIAAYEQAILLKPNYAQGFNNLGVALRDKKKLNEAAAAIRRAIELEPNDAETHYNLGGILMEERELDAARDALAAAIRLNPNHANVSNNLGSCWMMQEEPSRALPEFERAIQLDPNLATARFNRGLANLMLGDFRRGFPDYEWRAAVKPQFIFMREGSTRPRWDGKPLEGQTIFLHAEQGFGDTIQFVRFVPMVHERGGRVILGIQPQLERLMRQVPGVERIVSSIEPDLQYDVHCPLLSLPLALGTELASIPREVPYLKADVELAGRWKSRLNNPPVKTVGLAWAGSAMNEHDSIRTISLQQLEPLAKIKNVALFSLQKGEAAKELLPKGFPAIDWTNDLHDFSDTAALVENLDLVITVDSAVAHLAGAMGKPVWILIPYSPDWRWMTQREDNPWYPTARLFRQTKPGDWSGVIERVAGELQQLSRT